MKTKGVRSTAELHPGQTLSTDGMPTIERVAEAVMREHWKCWKDASSAELRECTHWPTALGIARVAINALREPTEVMILAGVHHCNMGDMAGRWRAMINAALAEGPQGPKPEGTSHAPVENPLGGSDGADGVP